MRLRVEDGDGLHFKKCSECGKTATEVINVETNVRQGWYCECKNFIKAIGRERTWKKNEDADSRKPA